MNKLILFVFIVLIVTGNIFCLDITLDTDDDGKLDRWLNVELYKQWKKLDINKNDKADESCFYVSDKNLVYFIKNETFDSLNMGKPNIFIKNTNKGKSFDTEIKADENGDGKVDLIVFKQNDKLYNQKADHNDDGIFDVEEEYNSDGIKIKEYVDSNKDGKMDDIYYFDLEGKLMKEELDTNFDGVMDMWVEFTYKANGAMEECVIKRDNNHDKKVDEWHYTDERRRVIKVEKDTDFDGKPDSIKKYK